MAGRAGLLCELWVEKAWRRMGTDPWRGEGVTTTGPGLVRVNTAGFEVGSIWQEPRNAGTSRSASPEGAEPPALI